MSEKHPGWGGKREGAGRPRTVNTGRHRDTPHRKRPELDSRHPVHVTLRLKEHFRISLRNGKSYRAIRVVLLIMLDQPGFRIVHFSIQSNHLHLLVEADNKQALSEGMRRFGIHAANAIHSSIGGYAGKVFRFRYNARQIKTASHARNAISYVLNNWRRHRRNLDCAGAMKATLDPYATGLSHPPWAQKFRVPDGYEPLPVSPPQTWLLKRGYKRYGEIDPWETPASWEYAWRL